MLNKVFIIGHLGADPDIHFSNAGEAFGSLSVATSEKYTDRNGQVQEVTTWHTVCVNRKTAENCQQYLHKGSLVHVEGKLRTRKYNDKNGVERYKTEILAQSVTFLDRKPDSQQGQPQQYGGAGSPRRAPARGGYNDAPVETPGNPARYGSEVPTDDMPF